MSTIKQDENGCDDVPGSPARDTNSRCKALYECIAPVYDALDAIWEISWKKPTRQRVFEGLSGLILDAGVGTGLNIPYYPTKSPVIGIDSSPAMLRRARARAKKIQHDITLLSMDIRKTAFPDDYFDAITSTFVFCTISEQDRLAAMKEFSRICKPDGRIRILDYCASQRPTMRAGMSCFRPWFQMVFNGDFDTKIDDVADSTGMVTLTNEFLLGDIVKLTELAPGPGKRRGSADASRQPVEDQTASTVRVNSCFVPGVSRGGR